MEILLGLAFIGFSVISSHSIWAIPLCLFGGFLLARGLWEFVYGDK